MSAANETVRDIELAVDMRNISKVYPNGIAANRNVDFSVRKGEIHALIGENGAGKSTLVKMLFGMEQPTEGEIYINGEKVHLTSPAQAIEAGIGMVHQHLMLVPSLTVAENMVLGMPPKKGISIDYDEAVRMTNEIAARYHFNIDAEKRVMDIPVGMKQKIEILKALLRGAEILILDEPTAVLTSNETVELFQQLRNLRDEGFTIIFISHRLNEIKELTDRMTIMRNGRLMGVHETEGISEQEISRLMVGRDVILELKKDEAEPQEVVLSVEDVTYTNEWNKLMLNHVSFNVRAGEIVGIAGVEGNGQRELVDILFGLRRAHTGEITVHGESILGRNQKEIRDKGVSLIPEDRMLYGIAAQGSITDNILADRFASDKYNNGPFFKTRKIRGDTDKLIEEYLIKARNQSQQVDMLSGGNIQKVVVAREFSSDPDLIIADQPTRGIDVGATEFIRKRLLDLSREGAAVLLVSADLSEVMEMSDRLLIFYGGEIVACFDDTSTVTDEIMGEYMLGLRRQDAKEVEEVAYV
ncbi:MAG: ABC transporter ATP-binding protein [Eubacteriales bacterium]|nr:ABC transporter ATP-binding protein [Eubacteriales bacterium]MDD4542101.1 ABC transporter ATP-binding protein [Eubacteriales bacterium]